MVHVEDSVDPVRDLSVIQVCGSMIDATKVADYILCFSCMLVKCLKVSGNFFIFLV